MVKSQLRKEGEDEDPVGVGGGYKWMVGQPVWERVVCEAETGYC